MASRARQQALNVTGCRLHRITAQQLHTHPPNQAYLEGVHDVTGKGQLQPGIPGIATVGATAQRHFFI